MNKKSIKHNALKESLYINEDYNFIKTSDWEYTNEFTLLKEWTY